MNHRNKTVFLPLLTVILALATFSCDFWLSDGDTPNFWAQDFKTNDYYQLYAELIYENDVCTIWAEKGSGVTAEKAQVMANAYSNTIYPNMIDTFSFTQIKVNDETYNLNAMEMADIYGDNDGKLCILLLDIKDDYEKDVIDSYVAGYFWAGNQYENDPSHSQLRYSNERDMIYVDVNPGVPGDMRSITTVAHEMQHMMNWTTDMVFRVKNQQAYSMDTWIDEGLSSAAEWLVSGDHSNGRWEWYDTDESGLIVQGNNFFIWDNHDDNQYANLDDYATVYLFFQWLRLQSSKGKGIYYDIISSSETDYKAVTKAAEKFDSSLGVWDTLLRTWLAANYLNNSTGLYGYTGEPKLKDVKANTLPESAIKTIPLYPGEGVYSYTDTSMTIPSSGAKISYAGLSNGNVVPSGSLSSGGALLTYNIDIDLKGSPASGTITGTAKPNIEPVPGRFVSQNSVPKGPFPIGAREVLRRNGHDK